MNDLVKYNLERAEESLRNALRHGCDKADAYLLKQIAEMLNSLRCMQLTSRYSVSAVPDDSIKISPNTPWSYYTGDHLPGGAGNDVFSVSKDAFHSGATTSSVINFG
jgi:hypothetical protein